MTSNVELINSKLSKASTHASKLFPEEFTVSDYVSLDLSVSNKELMTLGDITPTGFTGYIFEKINLLGGKIGFGGFFEERRWYQQSSHFDQQNEPRDIHLGVDFWVKEGTEVICPITGRIHSFQDNANYLDYGPTIILEHDLDGIIIYSLYGHLSKESILNKKVGQIINAGQVFNIYHKPRCQRWLVRVFIFSL